MKRKFKKSIALLLALSMITNMTNINVSASEKNAQEAVETQGKHLESNWDGTTTESVYETDSYRITFSLTSYWEEGYNANIKIDNIGNSVIENWYISYDLKNEISNMWDAEIYAYEEGNYIVKNAGWNQDIAIGESAQFGFSVNEVFNGFPSTYEFLGERIVSNSEAYSVEYHLDSNWESGFNGSVSITNNTQRTIEDWTLKFNFDREITNIWNGEIESREGNQYIITNGGFNSNIEAGQTVSFGFSGVNGSEADAPYDWQLYSYEIYKSDYIELADGKIDRDYLERAIYPYMLLKNMSIDNIMLADDYDEDKLTLEKEYEYDTDPFSKDTDEDGINDYDEIYVYFTNPIKRDTDNDGMGDSTEVECGFNPLVADSDGDGTEDDKESVTQNVRLDGYYELNENELNIYPMVQLTGKGDYSEQLNAVSLDNSQLHEKDFIVGEVYDFIHNDDLNFDSGKLSFKLGNEVLEENNIVDLKIAYYNEENNMLEILDTTYDKKANTISANVEHFSIYAVLNYKNFLYDSKIIVGEDLNEKINNADVVMDTYNNHTYRLFNVGVSWLDAYAYCEKLGGHLLVIDDAGEQEFINNLISKGTMNTYNIGLSGTDNQYSWITGVPLKYENWAYGEPNNRNETVVHMYGKNYRNFSLGQWNDTYNYLAGTTSFYATAHNGFICEWESEKVVQEGYFITLSDGSRIRLDADPSLGNTSFDTDGDGLSDMEELNKKVEITYKNPYTGNEETSEVWTFYSNPALADTDGDEITDLYDIYPTRFDVTVIENTEEYIKFNTGNIWYNISCTAFDYMDNVLQMVDGKVDNPIPLEEFQNICGCYSKNDNQNFGIDELAIIGLVNNEGSKLYMNDVTSSVREKVFNILTGRESKYYRHVGVFENATWEEVDKDFESGFMNGAVLSEADINFSIKPFIIVDQFTVYESIAMTGALIFILVFTVELAPIVATNLQSIIYYVKSYGVAQGLKMYRYLGTTNLPNGNIDWVTKKNSSGSQTGTVWDNIKATEQEISGTKIPRSFEISAGGSKFWVHPNGTKHMGEYITRYEISHGMPMNSQTLMTSFHTAVNNAVSQGIKYEQMMKIGNWELIFSQPRAEGLLPVIKHAVFIP